MFSCSRKCFGAWDVRQCCELNCPAKNSNEQFLACPMRVSTFHFMIGNKKEMYDRAIKFGLRGVRDMCLEVGLTKEDADDVMNLWRKDHNECDGEHVYYSGGCPGRTSTLGCYREGLCDDAYVGVVEALEDPIEDADVRRTLEDCKEGMEKEALDKIELAKLKADREKERKKLRIAQELATMRRKQDRVAKALLKNAIEATVAYGFYDEKKHWFLNEHEYKFIDRASFVSDLRRHQLYNLIVLSVHGYEREIERKVDELWDEWKEQVGTPSPDEEGESDESTDDSVN